MSNKKTISAAEKKKRAASRMDNAKMAGMMAGGLAAGVMLPNKVSTPVGLLLTVASFIGKPKPWMIALGLPMLGGLAVAPVPQADPEINGLSGGKFSIKDEFKKSKARSRNYLSALGESLWMDRIFKKNAGGNDPLVLQPGGEGTVGGLARHPALDALDRIDARIEGEAYAYPATDYQPLDSI